MAKFNKWVNNPYKRKIGPLTAQQEYDKYRHEVMRMNTIAKQRIQRSKTQGFENILMQMNRTKPMSSKDFNKLSKERQYEMLQNIKDRAKDMWNFMDLSTATVGGFKEMIKVVYKNKAIGTINLDFVDAMSESDAFKTIQSKIEANLAGMTAQYKTQQLFDEIDADTTLSEDDKEYIKEYIRALLQGEYFDYDQAYYYTVEEIKRMLPEIKQKIQSFKGNIDTSGEIDFDALDIV